MTPITIVDKNANLNVQVYSSLAALPAPTDGVIAIVDDGTTGLFFIATKRGGALRWTPLPTLANAVVTDPGSPSPPNPWVGVPNIINPTDAITPGLQIASSGAGGLIITASGDAPIAIEDTITPTKPDIDIVRDSDFTFAQPALSFNGGDNIQQNPINSRGVIVAGAYTDSTRPIADATTLGSIIRESPAGQSDVLKAVIADSAGHASYVQFYPPIIPPVPAQTQIRTSPDNLDALQQSLDGGATWTDKFVVTAAGNGTSLGFPPLPTNPGFPIDFWMMIPALGGCYFPYIVAAGYKIILMETSGLWGCNVPSVGEFICGGSGSPSIGAGNPPVGPVAINTALPVGQVVHFPLNAFGQEAVSGQTWQDIFLGYTFATDGNTILKSNIDDSSTGRVSYQMAARFRIIPPTITPAISGLDFSTSSYLFKDMQFYTPNDATWQSSNGWIQESASRAFIIYKRTLFGNSLSHIKATVRALQGFPNQMSVFIGSNLGGLNKLFYPMAVSSNPAPGVSVFESGGINGALPANLFVAGDFFHLQPSSDAGSLEPSFQLISFEYDFMQPGDPLQ